VPKEPNDSNRKRLLENIALNGMKHITVRPVGIGSAPDTLTMAYSPLMSGGATVRPMAVENLTASEGIVQQRIEITTLDLEIAAGGTPPDFIKIDTEGNELAALQGASNTLERYRPTLFLEMHGETMTEKKQNVLALAAFLTEARYHIVHVETGTVITPTNSEVAAQGHLYATPQA